MITFNRLNPLHSILRYFSFKIIIKYHVLLQNFCFRVIPQTTTARCPSFDPYTILAFLTFGIFLYYLFRTLVDQNATNRRSYTTLSGDRHSSETQRIYSCLQRGYEIWECWYWRLTTQSTKFPRIKIEIKSVQSSVSIHLLPRVKTRSKFAQSVEGEWPNSTELSLTRRNYCVLIDVEVFKTMLKFVVILSFVAVVQSKTNSSIDSVSSVGNEFF